MKIRIRRDRLQLDLFDVFGVRPRGAPLRTVPTPRRRRVRAGRCCGTPAQQLFLRTLYDRLNQSRFSGRLPADIPLRLSDRMSRRFGHVYYARDAHGVRRVTELALNVRLLARSNEEHLLDTMLHEMAHAEAWIFYGHRQHGARWKRICLRVGATPRACVRASPRRVPLPVERVPALPHA